MAITHTKTNTDFSTTPWTETKTTETFAVGAVLKIFTGDYRIMSDVWGTGKWAAYWNEAEGRIDSFLVDVCDYNWSNINSAEVDATPETLAKVQAYLFRKNLNTIQAEMQTASTAIQKGDTVTVVSGRTAKGTTGKVVVEMFKPYKTGWSSRDEKKYGIATSDVMIDKAAANGKVYKNYKDMVWVWARNCARTEARPVDMVEATKQAETRAYWEFKQNYPDLAKSYETITTTTTPTPYVGSRDFDAVNSLCIARRA